MLREFVVQRCPVPGLGVGETVLGLQEKFSVPGCLALVAGEDALERQVRGRGPQPRGLGRAVRQDAGHALAGERFEHRSAAGESGGFGGGAAAGGEQPRSQARR
jgi:hypothetical protein